MSVVKYRTSARERPVVGAHEMRHVDPASFAALSVEAQPTACTPATHHTGLAPRIDESVSLTSTTRQSPCERGLKIVYIGQT